MDEIIQRSGIEQEEKGINDSPVVHPQKAGVEGMKRTLPRTD